MTTFASATLDLARILMDVAEGTATGGNATTLVDTARTEPADYYDQGTIWLLSGNNSGKSAIISDWALTGTTFTFATLTLLNAAGDRYAVAPRDYPRYLLRIAINAALRTIGNVPAQNTATVTVADQEAYTLPAGVYGLKRVEIATSLTSPYEYQPHFNWKEIPGYLVFDDGHVPDTDDYIIRLTYVIPPTELTADADAVSNYVHPDRLKWEAAVHALRWRLQRTEGQKPEITTLLNEAISNAAREAARHKVEHVNRDMHMGVW